MTDTSTPLECTAKELERVNVELIDKLNVILLCKRCGKMWRSFPRPDGELRRGYWLCPSGCHADQRVITR